VTPPQPDPAALHPDPAALHPDPAALQPDPAAPRPDPAAPQPDPAAPHPDPPMSGPPAGEATPAPEGAASGHPQPPLLVCVGDLMVDVAVEAPALARGGDVAGAVRLGVGGSAANVAAWAMAAGGRARLVAGRGDDLAGRLLASALAERGIELRPARAAGAGSGAMLVVIEAGERTFVADPGANLGLAEADVVGALAGARAVFVSGYPLLRAPTRAAALAAAAGAGRVGAPAAVDAASWPLLGGGAGEPVLEAAALAGTLLANREEATALAGFPDPGAAGSALAARVGTVVVKCGPAGALVCSGEGPPRAVAAPAAEVVDVTGAGDAFAAGYLLARAAGDDPVGAAAAGAALAARAVATRGAWPGRPEYP
jgi:ribokinase